MASAGPVTLVGSKNNTGGGDTPVPSQDPAPSEAADGGRIAAETSVPEKLADDVMRPPLYKRLFYRVFPQLERS